MIFYNTLPPSSLNRHVHRHSNTLSQASTHILNMMTLQVPTELLASFTAHLSGIPLIVESSQQSQPKKIYPRAPMTEINPLDKDMPWKDKNRTNQNQDAFLYIPYLQEVKSKKAKKRQARDIPLLAPESQSKSTTPFPIMHSNLPRESHMYTIWQYPSPRTDRTG